MVAAKGNVSMSIARILGVAVVAVAGVATAMVDGPRSIAIGGATFAGQVDAAGLVVTSLRSGGAAQGAGLRVGDVVDGVDGVAHPGVARLAAAAHGTHAVLHVRPRGDGQARTLLLHGGGGGA
ncbi:hypothetical protein ASE78_02165 [Sphingomonas sp. Leaf25]|nr:hypothetical protein ASE78_02165 [Sphingomonas sp. Leaf25]